MSNFKKGISISVIVLVLCAVGFIFGVIKANNLSDDDKLLAINELTKSSKYREAMDFAHKHYKDQPYELETIIEMLKIMEKNHLKDQAEFTNFITDRAIEEIEYKRKLRDTEREIDRELDRLLESLESYE